jgi:hypothetical protein
LPAGEKAQETLYDLSPSRASTPATSTAPASRAASASFAFSVGCHAARAIASFSGSTTSFTLLPLSARISRT